MSSVNKVILVGNLGKDPEIRSTHDGREVANFTIATSETWKDKASGEKKEKTEWHKVSCFNEGLVNIIRSYLKKGSKVYIEGQLQTRKWRDQSGQDKYSTEIVLQGYNCNLTLLGAKSDAVDSEQQSATQAQSAPANGKTGYANDDLNDDISF